MPSKKNNSQGNPTDQFYLYTKLNENDTKNLRKA